MDYTQKENDILNKVSKICGRDFISFSSFYDYLEKSTLALTKTKNFLSLPTVPSEDAEELYSYVNI